MTNQTVKPLSRAEVYALIDGERDYQDRQWPENAPADPRPLSIGEDILLIAEYVAKARLAWSTERRPEVGALDQIRKIAGIVVRCMENHGAPPRVDASKPLPPPERAEFYLWLEGEMDSAVVEWAEVLEGKAVGVNKYVEAYHAARERGCACHISDETGLTEDQAGPVIAIVHPDGDVYDLRGKLLLKMKDYLKQLPALTKEFYEIPTGKHALPQRRRVPRKKTAR